MLTILFCEVSLSATQQVLAGNQILQLATIHLTIYLYDKTHKAVGITNMGQRRNDHILLFLNFEFYNRRPKSTLVYLLFFNGAATKDTWMALIFYWLNT